MRRSAPPPVRRPVPRRRRSGAVRVEHGHHDRLGQRQLRHHRPREPAQRARPRHPLPAHRHGRADSGAVRVRDDQRGQPRGLRAGHHPEPGHGQALRLRPARHHAGHHPGGGTRGADPAEWRDRDDRLRVQRHRPVPGGRDGERAQERQLRQRHVRIDLRAGVVLQRHQLLQRGVPG